MAYLFQNHVDGRSTDTAVATLHGVTAVLSTLLVIAIAAIMSGLVLNVMLHSGMLCRFLTLIHVAHTSLHRW